MTHPAYRGGKWRRIRLMVLERDGYQCQLRLPGCTRVARQVDHICPVLEGGAWHDPNNLRAACAPCNQKRKRKTGGGPQTWRLGKTRITLVVGPEDADLGGWVRARLNPGDVVVDDGELAKAIGNGEAVQAARAAIITRLRRAEIGAARAWISSHDPASPSSLPHHRLVQLPQRGSIAGPDGGTLDDVNDVTSGEAMPCDDDEHERDQPGSRTW